MEHGPPINGFDHSLIVSVYVILSLVLVKAMWQASNPAHIPKLKNPVFLL
jgi:hypothetical protein